jgi:hypothetical protein
LRHLNLAAHQVDAGDHLGDGVLHLDARIHFDEVPRAGIGIHQELHGAGVVIAGGLGQLDGGFGQRAADGIVEAHGGRHFDHFLVAALHGAIALVKVQEVAGAVAQDLHLDVAGVLARSAPEIRRRCRKRAGLAAGLRQPLGEFRGVAHHAHAAPAAAEGRFDDERKSDAARDALGLPRVANDGIFGAGNVPGCRRARPVGAPRFVAQHSSNSALGPMKVMPARSQARGRAGFSDRKP